MGKLLAPLSTCKRDQVSAIIFPTNCSSISAIGYNGPSSGLPNDSCMNIEGDCGCVHAETNALIKLNVLDDEPCLMFSTRAPCRRCAALILNCSPIIGLIWDTGYRNNDGLHLLHDGKLPTFQLDNFRFKNDANFRLLRLWKNA